MCLRKARQQSRGFAGEFDNSVVYLDILYTLRFLFQGISPGYREEYIVTKSYDPANLPLLEYYIEMVY